MARPIETTLALLQDVMTQHRRALAGPTVPPPSRVAVPLDRRGAVIQKLLAGVERRVGVEVSQPATEKLLRVFGALDIAELEAWVSKIEPLPASHPEWSSLIESLTVHETYVMRDPSQLQLLAAQLPGVIADAAAARMHVLHFWSVGCATGEEAYSVAALALDVLVATGHAIKTDVGADLLAPWRIEVVGADISHPALKKARTGIFDTGPLSSFRAESAPLLRYFPLLPGVSSSGRAERTVSSTLKSAVRFEHLNIIEDTLSTRQFDVVLCRNVLIYFSARARQLAQKRLCNALRPGGYLLLGPTDSLVDVEDFEALWASGAVIYRRRKNNG